ncbi:hypothetical protein [Parasitella parasitica]|uniref:HTH APSES-type domain-containing protein n=1 Tax=Parasitella parasitica TaxID=35722 RepID=A0A0B7MU17_9FUNG|nr:hypothetical protein [Parasitella parasitica]
MFSYDDPIFQANNNSPVKDTGFTELTCTASPNTTNTINYNNDGPMYPFNDMLYSLAQQNVSTTDLDAQQHHHHSSMVSNHQQHQQQQAWRDQQRQQPTNLCFTTDTQQQDQSPYHHYNNSPFSSPLIYSNNTMIINTASQRSSIQSLASVHPIPSAPPSLQQEQQKLQYPQYQHQQHHQQQQTAQSPRITTSLWDDEETVCYQVDVRGICVARRQDNDMVNGTKLLNVTGMSRGKRDGILKNEKGRVVVKVGAMHLKGVWVTFARAKALAIQYNIVDQLHPLFVDDPASHFYSKQVAHNYYIPNHPIYLQSQDSFHQQHQQHQLQQNTRSSSSAYSIYSNNNSSSSLEFPVFHSASSSLSNYPHYQPQQHQHHLHSESQVRQSQEFHYNLLAAPSVPSMIPAQQHQMPLYEYTTSTTTSPTNSVAHHSIPITANTSITTATTSTTLNPAIMTTDSIMTHY